MTEQVSRLFPDTPVETDFEHIGADYVATARAIAQICATRVLLLIAVITGAGIWSFTIVAPTMDRLYAAVAFSIVFVLPQTVLYLKRG